MARLDGVAGDIRKHLPGSHCPLELAGGKSFPWVGGGLQSRCTILLRFGLLFLVGAVDHVPGRPAVLQASLESELVIEGG